MKRLLRVIFDSDMKVIKYKSRFSWNKMILFKLNSYLYYDARSTPNYETKNLTLSSSNVQQKCRMHLLVAEPIIITDTDNLPSSVN